MECTIGVADLSPRGELRLPEIQQRLLRRIRTAASEQARAGAGGRTLGSDQFMIGFLTTDPQASREETVDAFRDLVSAQILQLSVPSEDEFFEKLREVMCALELI